MANSKDLSVVLGAFSKPVYQVATGAPVNLGSTGISLAAALLSRTKAFAGTPIPSVWAGMITPPINLGLYIGSWFGMPITAGTPRLKGIGGYAQSILSFIPILGSVVSAMLGNAFGKTIQSFKSPYYYYDPATRSMGRGTQLGEPIDQFGSASRDWSNVQAGIQGWIAQQYASQYGLDPNKLMEWGYGGEMPSELGVPITGSVRGEYYTAKAMNMINDVLEKGGGITNFLNPTEQQVLANYNTLFNREQTVTGTGGPSPYQVYLAGLGS